MNDYGSSMALSKKKTPLAVLRSIIGPAYGQEARFAKMIGMDTPATLKKLCAGLRPLSPELAMRVSEETGASPDWLLGKVKKPRNVSGGPYTKADYEKARLTRRFAAEAAGDDLAVIASDQLGRMDALMDFFRSELMDFVRGACARADREFILWSLREACRDRMAMFPEVVPVCETKERGAREVQFSFAAPLDMAVDENGNILIPTGDSYKTGAMRAVLACIESTPQKAKNCPQKPRKPKK
jgi:hypothetical protein